MYLPPKQCYGTFTHYTDIQPLLNAYHRKLATTDLSRRQSLYTLHGLSLREYLEYEGIASVKAFGFEDLLSRHTEYAPDIVSRIKIMKHFDRYLGYYPYYKEAGEDYLTRVGEVARLVIDGDIPAVEDITYATVQKIKKLLMVIAENVPLEPNINKLASQLESTRDILCKPNRSRPAAHHAEAGRFHGRRETHLRSRRQRQDLRPDCRPT